MLSTTTNDMRRSSPQRAKGRARMLQTAVLALACTAVATPGLARSAARDAFDGNWSVLIMTQNGPCDPSLRYGVQISNGQVINNGAAAVDIQGRVNPSGMVRVNVQAGGQWASGSGRLNLARGGGVWQGQGSAGACSGTWVAQRRSAGIAAGPGGQIAQAPGGPIYNFVPPPGPVAEAPGGPIYNFVPPPGPMAEAPGAPQAQSQDAAAYCAERFRTYDPASGTYMGYDGMRHPCP
jgi:BA14K-like protein